MFEREFDGGSMPADVDARRNALVTAVKAQRDAVSRARKIYFDTSSYALEGKHDVEFEIKKAIADKYGIAFRSVVFSGSAQLGFSPYKDTSFVPGRSDLDVACIDSSLFQYYWSLVLRVTKAFNDESVWVGTDHSAKLKSHLLKRGMILLDYLPRCPERTKDMAFLDDISRVYRAQFNRISLAIYINEAAFCWKQASALANIIGNDHA
ncbi:hypothetical protein GR212_00270 [Rhizobium lusitanum]|uniref:Uncharacterized protein n=1 Tax=Rhizobium lusitanum TaxID=293958 RepID=A0A6L9U0J5_9HYPH|nr:hypothetical protein [Rhizobium lusitanum]NEI67988.1 hypothetical protein [Rhizobium lusitanum]